ncbi:MAG: hypothetical protein GTO45_32445 [Candidatus Aminicenantes bacterium]|nr:hypothetical protein [Candidatus Aminicenantes bacterium]NIM83461.1 hypothetical protein [Candidatus Aminicenantes bacterium]NIN22853.1 hypothetical protein [Candidatus Aminicenantes bacterium]NIN46589.1 hypothetical protein [Candidatus Aminicenantes bacterium]NIN89492.1 hypothetical protein [Candidatus Aminicenantes bacterium]
MKFIVKDEIFDIFPNLKIGLVVGRGLTIRKQAKELQTLIKSNVDSLLERVGSRNLTDFSNIRAWRETYRKFGASPKKYRPTAEAFLRRILKGHPFPNINTAVDAYLAVELLSMLPIGGYDLNNITGDIQLRISQGGEVFFPIGGENIDPEYTVPGEIIYADNKIVLTRNWNYRDSDLTKITEDSTEIILASEAALDDINAEDVSGTVNKIVEYETAACQGEYYTYLLDKKKPEVIINN